LMFCRLMIIEISGVISLSFDDNSISC
jgi:hypothetical protein